MLLQQRDSAGGGEQIELRNERLGIAPERGKLPRGNRDCRRQCHRERIARDSRDAELIVQVRPRGPAGLADESDDLPLFDPHAAVNAVREGPQVAV